MSPDLKALLDEAAEPVAERDFVREAWDGARARRRRTRVVTAGVAAAAAAVVAAVVVIPRGADDRRTLPATTPTPSASAPWKAEPVDVLGVDAVVGPTPEQVRELPRGRVPGLPSTLSPDLADIGRLSDEQPRLVSSGDNSAPVTAIVLRYGERGTQRPVLYRPGLADPWQEVDSLGLNATTDVAGNASDFLGDRAIAPGGLQVAFAQPNEVVILDVPTATARRVAVDDPYLQDVGWTDDGRSLVAASEGQQWNVDVASGRVSRYGDPGYPGRYRLAMIGDRLTLSTHDPGGGATGSRALPPVVSSMWGESHSTSQFVASGGFLSEAAQQAAPTQGGFAPYQGVLVTDTQLSDPRLLLVSANPQEEFSKGCCRALQWTPDGQLLLLWGGDLVTYDAISRDFRWVASAPRTESYSGDFPPVGSLSTAFAIAP